MLVDIPILNTELNLMEIKCHKGISKPLNIISLKEKQLLNSFETLHINDFYGIWLQEKGQSVHVLNSQKYKVSNGECLLFKEQHNHQLLDIKDIEGYLFVFSQSFYEIFKKGISITDFDFYNENTDDLPIYNLTSEQTNQLLNILILIHKEYSGKENAEILWAFTHALLVSLERILSRNYKHQPSHSQDLMHDFEQLIKKWYIRHLPVSVYANELNISPNYLNHLCKKRFGKNAKKIIDDRLLTEAKRALFSGSFSISEIAFELNFKDASYFSRFFKKQTGKTPETFRNKHILE